MRREPSEMAGRKSGGDKKIRKSRADATYRTPVATLIRPFIRPAMHQPAETDMLVYHHEH
jgi:hypothetical protein